VACKILLLDCLDFLIGLLYHFGLFFWNDDVIHADGSAKESRILKAHFFDCVEHIHGDKRARVPIDMLDQHANVFIGHCIVYVRNLFWQSLV